MKVTAPSAQAYRNWVEEEITRPLEESFKRIIDIYFDDEPAEDRPLEELYDMAEREYVVLLEEYSTVELVGRFDGENTRDRETHRRNFNGLFNPFVLLVSRVGEEGIDLQKQCRYVIHLRS